MTKITMHSETVLCDLLSAIVDDRNTGKVSNVKDSKWHAYNSDVDKPVEIKFQQKAICAYCGKKGLASSIFIHVTHCFNDSQDMKKKQSFMQRSEKLMDGKVNNIIYHLFVYIKSIFFVYYCYLFIIQR